MRQHRRNEILTLRYDQRDYMPTITEGQILDTHTPIISRPPFPSECESRNGAGHVKSNQSDVRSLLLGELRLNKHTNDAEELCVSNFASNVVSGTHFSVPDCFFITVLIVKMQIWMLFLSRVICQWRKVR